MLQKENHHLIIQLSKQIEQHSGFDSCRNLIDKGKPGSAMQITIGHLCTPKMAPDRFEWHTHETFEIYYMLSGAGHFLIGQEAYAIYPGTLLILRPDEMHKAVIESDQPYERIFVHFSPDVLRPIDPELRLLAPFINRPVGKQNLYNCKNCDTTFIERCLNHIDTLVDTNYDDSLALRSCLYPILLEIGKAFRQTGSGTCKYREVIIPRILDYIHLNLGQDLSKQTLCSLFYISPSHLGREFKRATGQSVSNYIRERRLIQARRLIHSGASVTEAAAKAGFKDYSAFYRAYRTQFGTGPRQTGRQSAAPLSQKSDA